MVFLSDHRHVVATEKIRNMRTLKPRSTCTTERTRIEALLIYDARGVGTDREDATAPGTTTFEVRPRDYQPDQRKGTV